MITNKTFVTQIIVAIVSIVVSAGIIAAPTARAQVFFGSGGTTNTALNQQNVALGYLNLSAITTGVRNVATGYAAMRFDTTGGYNTATGFEALYSNTTGSYNTAIGYGALIFNTVTSDNTAVGYEALFNCIGAVNTAVGYSALQVDTTGYANTAFGVVALGQCTTGQGNIAVGDNAGYQIVTGNQNIDIGNDGVAGDGGVGSLGVIRIGFSQTHCFIAGIANSAISDGVGTVIVNSAGQLGILPSSRRFKTDINPMGTASSAIFALRPVTFRYNNLVDSSGGVDVSTGQSHRIQYGLIAEDVEKVAPTLVTYDKEGKPFTVNYSLLIPMLLNELQKSHQDQLQANQEIAALRANQAQLQAAQERDHALLVSLAQVQAQAQARPLAIHRN
jgi:hypothetical protein